MLKFIFGVMGCGKSTHAIVTKKTYENMGFQVCMLKPSIDTRSKYIKSRLKLKSKCISFDENDNILDISPGFEKPFNKCLIIVDEVQFCTKEQIEQLKELSSCFIVLCYGFKTNFKSQLFEGSKRLIELADELEEIPYYCECGKKAQINALFENNKLVTTGREIRIGDWQYKSLCYDCYKGYKKKKI